MMQSVGLGLTLLLIKRVETSEKKLKAARVLYADIVTTQRCSDLRDGPVGTPAAYEEKASKTVESLVVGVWDHLLLWGLVIKP